MCLKGETEFCKSYLKHYLRPILRRHNSNGNGNVQIHQYADDLLNEMKKSNILLKHQEKKN